MRQPPKRAIGAIAVALSLVIGVPVMADQTRPIEPVPQAEFTPLPSTFRSQTEGRRPLSQATPEPTPKPTPKPKPKPKPVVKKKRVVVPVVRGTVGVVAGSRIARAYARSRLNAVQYTCLNTLWVRESGWRWNALNRSSGAYGIPQALPGSKMASAGSDWKTNPVTQVKWGLGYIHGRYGTACAALRHSNLRGWY